MSNRNILLIISFVVISLSVPEILQAAVKLPSWASSSNLEQSVSSTGKKVADILSAVVGILGVIGMLIGAACFPLNKPDQGKAFVVWSAVGLTIAALVYGIAALFIKS